MPIGQPDSSKDEGGRPPSNPPPELRSGPYLATEGGIHLSRAERLIHEAMEAGEFEGLTGTGRPIPGAGTTDDELWWVRKWVERNRPANQESSSSV